MMEREECVSCSIILSLSRSEALTYSHTGEGMGSGEGWMLQYLSIVLQYVFDNKLFLFLLLFFTSDMDFTKPFEATEPQKVTITNDVHDDKRDDPLPERMEVVEEFLRNLADFTKFLKTMPSLAHRESFAKMTMDVILEGSDEDASSSDYYGRSFESNN